MPKMLLLFSHTLTDEQRQDAKTTLHIDAFVSLPPELQMRWGNIPPTSSSISEYLEPFRHWMRVNASSGDYVLIQGDFGAVYLLVTFAFSVHLIPVYATTERVVEEKHLPDNTVRSERIFKHRLFRRYEQEPSHIAQHQHSSGANI